MVVFFKQNVHFLNILNFPKFVRQTLELIQEYIFFSSFLAHVPQLSEAAHKIHSPPSHFHIKKEINIIVKLLIHAQVCARPVA